MPAVEDYDLWVRIAKFFPIYGTMDVLYVKTMPEGEHVSRNFKKVKKGYESIFRFNKVYYEKKQTAKRWILYNIIRAGIKGKDPATFIYIPEFIRTYIMSEIGHET